MAIFKYSNRNIEEYRNSNVFFFAATSLGTMSVSNSNVILHVECIKTHRSNLTVLTFVKDDVFVKTCYDLAQLKFSTMY